MQRNNYSILIVDDEELAREKIKFFLTKMNEGFDITEAQNVTEALDHLTNKKFDIVFLDIEMPKQVGLNLFAQLPEGIPKFEVIFQTAYAEYAYKAFEVEATDYLLKPYTYERFVQAMGKAMANIELRQGRTTSARKKSTRESSGTQTGVSQFLIKQGDERIVVELNQIMYIKSDGNYSNIYTERGRVFTMHRSLNRLEAVLDKNVFVRVHRKFICNVNYIIRVKKNKTNASIIMKDNTELLASTAKTTKLLSVLYKNNVIG